MGRKKIEIEPVKDPNARQVTFCKRRRGLFKKANELSILCGSEIGAIVFSPGNKPYSFGHPDVDAVAAEFLQQDQPNPNEAQGSSSSSKDSNLEELMEQQLIGLKNQSCEEAKKGLQEMHESMADLRCKIKERLNEMEAMEALLLLKEQPVEFTDNNHAAKNKRRRNN